MGTNRLLIPLCLAGCVVGTFIAGFSYKFVIYEGYVKSHFNLTQSEVSTVASAELLGAQNYFLSGYLDNRFGPRITVTVSTIYMAASLFPFWTSMVVGPDYQPGYLLLALYFLLSANAASTLYIPALTTAIWNVPVSFRGRITSLVDIVHEMTIPVLVFIYWRVSIKEEPDPYANMGTFTLAVIVSFTVLLVLIIPCLRRDENEFTTGQSNSVVHYDESDSLLERRSQLRQLNEDSFLRLVLSREYQLVAWSIVLAMSIAHLGLLSFDSVTKALGQQQFYRQSVLLFYGGSYVGRVLAGYVMDRLAGESVFFVFFFFCIFLSLVSQVLFFLPTNEALDLVIIFIVLGTYYGALSTGTALVTCELYGTRNIGRNISPILLLRAVIVMGLEVVYGKTYMWNIERKNDHYCHGKNCIIPQVIVNIILAVIASSLAAILAYIRYKS